jgi:hypothetical protein
VRWFSFAYRLDTPPLTRGMANFQDRVAKLEQRYRPRPPNLPSGRRKCLTDRAVAGDHEALQELNLHRRRITQASPQQRAAAVAAGLRAGL